jgi:hypothetical protein
MARRAHRAKAHASQGKFEKEAETALGLPPSVHSYALLPIGTHGPVRASPSCCVCRCGLQRRLTSLTGPRRPGTLSLYRVPGPADISAPTCRDAAVGPFVVFLTLRTSHTPPCRDAAVTPVVVFLALRTSHTPPCRDAAVRAFVELLALRTSHAPPCRDAAVRGLVKFLALRTSLGRTHPSQSHAFVFYRNEYLTGRTVTLRCRGDRNQIRCDKHCGQHKASAKTQAQRPCFPTHGAPPFDEARTTRSVVARSRSKRVLEAILFCCGVRDNKVLV